MNVEWRDTADGDGWRDGSFANVDQGRVFFWLAIYEDSVVGAGWTWGVARRIGRGPLWYKSGGPCKRLSGAKRAAEAAVHLELSNLSPEVLEGSP